jgi:acetate CoA/acetoacetate CoA-transferase alpha subunit
VEALVARRARHLTIIALDFGAPGIGVGRLIEAGCVGHAIVARAGDNPVARARMMRGAFAVELLGIESFTERIRAAGRGLGGVLVPAHRAAGAEPRPLVALDGLPFAVERPLRAQFALLAASRADAYFDLAYAQGTSEMAALMAGAADCVVAEPAGPVEQDALPTSVLQTSGVVVSYLVCPAR